jgi:hypothetical protein
MDNWRKYMAENEDNLSIEDVDDKVWHNVHKAAVPKRRSFINEWKTALGGLFQKYKIGNEGYAGKSRNGKFKLAYALVFVAFVTASFAFKVKTNTKYGDVVTFELAKSYQLNGETPSTRLFHSFSRAISPSNPTALLFFKYIEEDNSEAKQIISNLKDTKGVFNLNITPVVFEFTESLFSSFLNKAFDIQLNKAKPNDKQIKNKVEDVLKEKGLTAVNIHINDYYQDVVAVPNIVDRESQLPNLKDTVLLQKDKDRSKVSGNVDTTKPNKDSRTDISNLNSSGWKQDLALMTKLTNALEKDELVDNKKPYKLEIKDGELYINGEKQSKEVSDKFRKYFKNDNYTVTNDGDQPASTSNHKEVKDKPKAEWTYPGTNILKFDPVEFKKEMKMMNQLIDGLVKDGLIARDKPYEVNIKGGELYIDRKKQPKEVSDKFRQYFWRDNYGFIND